MATLFDSLQKKLSQPNDVPGLGLAPQQKTVADSLRAKAGKATAGAGPRASNLGEQSAIATGTAALGQAQTAGQILSTQIGAQVEDQRAKTQAAENQLASNERIANTALANASQGANEAVAGQEQMALDSLGQNETLKVEQINTRADQALREMASERGIAVDQIFRDRDRSAKELAFRKDAAELEQVGFLLAMKDKAYVDELERIGAERDLSDKLNFQEEMQNVILGENLTLMLDQMGGKSALMADQRTWNEYLAKIDADAALALAQATLADEAKAQMISGVGNLAKAGIDAYYQYGSDDADSTDS